MKQLIFSPADESWRVRYVTNLIGNNENLSIYAIESIKDGVLTNGLLAEGQAIGLFQHYTESTLSAFKAKAVALNLNLRVYEDGQAAETFLKESVPMFSSFELDGQEGNAVIDHEAGTIDINFLFGSDVTALEATFNIPTNGATVKIGEVAQVSEVTKNNFTAPKVYTLESKGGNEEKEYTVTVTILPASEEKLMLDYAFLAEGNDDLSVDVVGVIDDENGTIALEVPNGTAVTALIATFSSSPLSNVDIADTPQVSGTTGNDFTNPVTYTVVAEDDTEKEYVVTVTEAASTEADIKTFAIATGSEAVINNTAKTITVEMPNGTNVTELTPTFTISDNATIKVGTTEQVSGVTANDFTNPVTYVVTAEDGLTVNEWVVTVTEASAE